MNTLFDLSTSGLLKISGPDAKQLLQGQFTCDVESVTPTRSCMGAHCNPQGRIISLFYLFQFQDAYYLFLPRNMLPLTMATLKKYALFYQVQLVDASDQLMAMGTSSPPARENGLAVIRLPSRAILIGEVAEVKTIWEALAQSSHLAALSAWECLNITEGIPTIYPETTGKFLPHEINLHQLEGISFNKGCYTGQEIIARMHYRGKLKKHLYKARITSTTPPQPGLDLFSHQAGVKLASGILVAACQEEDHNNYCVLLVTEEPHAKDHHLFLDNDPQTFTFIG